MNDFQLLQSASPPCKKVAAEEEDIALHERSFVENARDSRFWTKLRQTDAVDSIEYIKNLMQEFGPAMKSRSVERSTAVLKTTGVSIGNGNEVSSSSTIGNSQETASSSSSTPSSSSNTSGNSQETSSDSISSSTTSNNSQEVSSMTSLPVGNTARNSQEITSVGLTASSSSNAAGNSQEMVPHPKRAPSVSTNEEIQTKFSGSSSMHSQKVSKRVGNNSVNSQEVPPTSVDNFMGNSHEIRSSSASPAAANSQEIRSGGGAADYGKNSGGNSQKMSSSSSSSATGNSQEVSSNSSSMSNSLKTSSTASRVGNDQQTKGSVSNNSQEVRRNVGNVNNNIGNISGNSQEVSGNVGNAKNNVGSGSANNQEVGVGLNDHNSRNKAKNSQKASGSNSESVSSNSQEVSGSTSNRNPGSVSSNSQEVSGSTSNPGSVSSNSQEVSGSTSNTNPESISSNSQEVSGSVTDQNQGIVSSNSQEVSGSVTDQNQGIVSSNSQEVSSVINHNRSAAAPRQLGPGSPLTAAVMLGAPLLAGALYAGASAPNAPGGLRRQDTDATGDEPYWQRLLQRTVGNLRDTASYVEDQVRDFFELERSNERNAAGPDGPLGVIPGRSPPGLIQLNQNQVMRPLRMNPHGVGNPSFGNPSFGNPSLGNPSFGNPLGPNEDLRLRLPYIDGVPVFQNIQGLQQVGAGGQLERGETATGKLPASSVPVRQGTNPFLNLGGTPFTHTLNAHQLMGAHGGALNKPILSQGIDPVLQRLIASGQAGLPMTGQIPSQLPYGGQSLPSEQFIRIAETGQVVPLRALHSQILDGLINPDSVPARRFDGALSRQLNGPEFLNVPDTSAFNESVRRIDVNPMTMISDRRQGLSPKDSDATMASKIVPSSLNFLGAGKGSPPGRLKGPLQTPSLQIVNGTVQYKAGNGRNYLLGMTAGTEKMKRRKRPGRLDKNKKSKLKNQRNRNQNLLANNMQQNLLSANAALNARTHQMNTLPPQATGTFAMLPETKAEDFQIYDPLAVQLRSYNHKYEASEEKQKTQEDANAASFAKIEPQRPSFQDNPTSTPPTEHKSDPLEMYSNLNKNLGSPVTKVPNSNYTTRFRVIDMDLKTQLRIAKEKLNISDLQSVRTASNLYGDLKPETLLTEKDLESLRNQSPNMGAVQKKIQRFSSRELFEHRPPIHTPTPEIKPSTTGPVATHFLDKRNHLVIGGGLHRKVADPKPLPNRDDLKEQNHHPSRNTEQKTNFALYRDDFSHPHLSPLSREAFQRTSQIHRLIAMDKYRANAEKELHMKELNRLNKDLAGGRTTPGARREMGKVAPAQTNFDYRNHDISSVASSTVPSMSIQKTNRPAEYPFYKFKAQTSRFPTSIQDVIAQAMGLEPASLSSSRKINSFDFNRFRNYNSPLPEYERRNSTRFSNDYNYDENVDRLSLDSRPSSIEPEKKTMQGSLYHTYKNRKDYEHDTADHLMHDKNLRKIPGATEDSPLTIQPASFEVFDIITDKNKKENKNVRDPNLFSDHTEYEPKDHRTRTFLGNSDRMREDDDSRIRFRTKNFDSFLTDESSEAQMGLGKNARNDENRYSKETRVDYESSLRSKYLANGSPEISDRDMYNWRQKYSTGQSFASKNIPDRSNQKSPAVNSYEDTEYSDTSRLRRRKVESNSRRPFRKRRTEVEVNSPEKNDRLDDENEYRSPSLDRNNAPNIPRRSLSAELEDYIRTNTKVPSSHVRSKEHSDSGDNLQKKFATETTESYPTGPRVRRRRKPMVRRRNRFRLPLNSRNSNDNLSQTESFSGQGYGQRKRPIEIPVNKHRSKGSDAPPFADDYTDPESRYRTRGLRRDSYEDRFNRQKFRAKDRTVESETEHKRSQERHFYPEDEDMSVSPSVKHEATRDFMGLKRNTASRFMEGKSKYDSTIEMLKAKRDAIGPKALNAPPPKKIPSSSRSPFLPSDATRNKVKRNDEESIATKKDTKPKEPQVITLENVSGDHSGIASRKSFYSKTPSGPSFLKRIQDQSAEDDPIISNLKAVFLENANDHQKSVKSSFWNLDAPRTTEPISVFNTPAPASYAGKRKSVIRRKKVKFPEFSQVSRMGLPLNSVEIIRGKISQFNLPRKPHQRQHDAFSRNKQSSNTAPNLSITEGSAENKEEEQYESLSNLMPMRLVAPQPENLNSVASSEQVEDNFKGKTVDFLDKVSTEDVRSRPFERAGAGVASGSTEYKGQMVYGESFSTNQMQSGDIGQFSPASADANRGLISIGEIKLPGSGQKILVETAVPEFFQSGPGSIINVLYNRGNEVVVNDTSSDAKSREVESISVDELSIGSEEPRPSTRDSSLLSFSSFSVPVPEAKTFTIDEDSALIDQLSGSTKKASLRSRDKEVISVQNNGVLGDLRSGEASLGQLGQSQGILKTDTDHFKEGTTPAINNDDISVRSNIPESEKLSNGSEKSDFISETLGKINEELKQNAGKADSNFLIDGNTASVVSKTKIIPGTQVKKIVLS
ncbi:hypothetical protein FHG87_006573 [Trinorchestia longiramus]|nr:hypothetical protein FHG87_006573 [Trinorchestia longiramus]